MTTRNPPVHARLTIGSLEAEGRDLYVRAQYNPKEVQLAKPVPWTDHPELGAEYGGRAPRTTTLELLFDGFEDRRFDVQGELDKLERLSSPRDASSPSEAMRRPHRCVVVWGARGMPALRCVIDSVTTKYTMFAGDGRPLRATCTVSVREVDVHRMWKEADATDERGVRARQDSFAAG